MAMASIHQFALLNCVPLLPWSDIGSVGVQTSDLVSSELESISFMPNLRITGQRKIALNYTLPELSRLSILQFLGR
jgi:hypothetical protein